jgi:GT2 family glycosyltransferase
MDLSIVIVNWNTAGLLARCLESIYAHACSSDFVVWVVDNASSDGSPQMVCDRFPQAKLIRNEENLGFARANNQAIEGSCGRYILLLNPDTEVKPKSLDILLEFMEGHPQAGAAGARLLNPDGTLQDSCYPAPTLSRELWFLLHLDRFWPHGSYDMSEWALDAAREVDAVTGACLILRREILDQVGLLDEGYFMYSEEIDLCYRLQQAGRCIYWVPQATVMHYGGQSTKQVAATMFLQLYGGKIRYYRKNHGHRAAQIYKGILLLAALGRLTLSPLALLESPSRRRRHLVLAGQYGNLIRELPRL